MILKNSWPLSFQQLVSQGCSKNLSVGGLRQQQFTLLGSEGKVSPGPQPLWRHLERALSRLLSFRGCGVRGLQLPTPVSASVFTRVSSPRLPSLAFQPTQSPRVSSSGDPQLHLNDEDPPQVRPHSQVLGVQGRRMFVGQGDRSACGRTLRCNPDAAGARSDADR